MNYLLTLVIGIIVIFPIFYFYDKITLKKLKGHVKVPLSKIKYMMGSFPYRLKWFQLSNKKRKEYLTNEGIKIFDRYVTVVTILQVVIPLTITLLVIFIGRIF